jgi:hypothetical protein
MRHAARGVVDHALEVDCDEVPLDEIDDWPPDRQLDFIARKQLPRSPGYLERWRRHEERVEVLSK